MKWVVDVDLAGDELDSVRPRCLGAPFADLRRAGQVHAGGGQHPQQGRLRDKDPPSAEAPRACPVDRDGAVTGQLVPATLDVTQGRLRSVRLGPDAALYLTADNGSDDEAVRVTPTG